MVTSEHGRDRQGGQPRRKFFFLGNFGWYGEFFGGSGEIGGPWGFSGGIRFGVRRLVYTEVGVLIGWIEMG